jgi:histidyl-tRNA synthetase
MKTIVPSVKGTRDFYPEEMAVRSWLTGKIRKVSQLYGYQEFEGPFLERLDLYAKKSGEELVNQQSYVFEDRGGDRLTLRPEMTPTLARMIAQRQNELVFPARWWMFGPFWRYERPQKGRTREFFQWNIDLLGANTPECDAEMLAVIVSLFQEVGLGPEKVCVGVNSRRLMNEELSALGIAPDMLSSATRIIDRRDKLAPKEWEQYALTAGLTEAQVQGILRMQSDPDLWQKSDELRRVFTLMERMGMREYIEYNPEIIRGLDYYTGIVFEAQDREGGRALLGGGHYDNLVGAVGGDPLPGTGFAMGDVMILVVLQKYGLLPDFARVPAETLVTVFDEEGLPDSFALAASLRNEGLRVVVYPEAIKLQKQLKYADRIGVRCVLIAGPDERAVGQVTVKDLQARTQETMDRTRVADFLREKLAEEAPV